MVDIYDIGAGWASLKIGECVFDVSYLSDLKSELDNLFKFDIHDINTIDFKANKIILDSCGVCMYIDYEQRLDLFISGKDYAIDRGYKGNNAVSVFKEEK